LPAAPFLSRKVDCKFGEIPVKFVRLLRDHVEDAEACNPTNAAGHREEFEFKFNRPEAFNLTWDLRVTTTNQYISVLLAFLIDGQLETHVVFSQIVQPESYLFRGLQSQSLLLN